MTSHDRARRLLLAERASLRCLLTGLDYDPSANGKDSGDLAMANERKESTSRDIERALTKIGDIDAALARIGAGTYGVCDACARPVSAVRLKALRTTLHCLDCAARLERESDDRKYRGAAAVASPRWPRSPAPAEGTVGRVIRFFCQGLPKSMQVGKSISFQRTGSPVRQHFQKRVNTEWAMTVGQIGRAHAPAVPLEGALLLMLRFYVPKPASLPKRTAALALPIKRPDLENLLSKLSDHFNGVFWHDDSQIVDLIARKRYPVDGRTGVEITVAPITNVQLQAELEQVVLDVEPARA